MSVFGVFQVPIFPHQHRIRRDASYLPVFSPNAGKYGPEKLRIRTLFTQWSWWYSEVYSEFCKTSKMKRLTFGENFTQFVPTLIITLRTCSALECVFLLERCLCHGVKSVRIRSFPGLIFTYSDWIWRDTEYLCVFTLNAGKYGPEKTRIRTFFTHRVRLLNYSRFILTSIARVRSL